MVAEIERWCWVFLVIAIPLLVLATLGTLIWHVEDEAKWLFRPVQLISAAACWTTILALAGCCERLLKRERPVIRYLVDASYWIYLAHMPLTIFIPALFRYWDAPGLLKMIVSIVLSGLRIPLAYAAVFYWDLGVGGIWWVISITGIVRGIVMAYWFQRNAWKQHTV